MVGVTAKIEGLEGLLALMQMLGKQSTINRISRGALTKAARIIRQRARQLVPVATKETLARSPGLEPKLLKKSLDIKVWTKNNVVIAFVGPARGFRRQAGVRTRGRSIGYLWYQNPIKYAHLVEGDTRGRPGKRFMQNALASTQSKCLNVIKKHIWTNIQKAWSKGMVA